MTRLEDLRYEANRPEAETETARDDEQLDVLARAWADCCSEIDELEWSVLVTPDGR